MLNENIVLNLDYVNNINDNRYEDVNPDRNNVVQLPACSHLDPSDLHQNSLYETDFTCISINVNLLSENQLLKSST